MTETLTDLVSKLERAHSAFCEVLVELGETDRLDERPQAGEWSAREVTAHQVNSERLLRAIAEAGRTDRAANSEVRVVEGETGSMAEFDGATLARLVRLLESERESTLALLAHATDADLGHECGMAPWGEELTLGRVLAVLVAHQGRHTAQFSAMLRTARAS